MGGREESGREGGRERERGEMKSREGERGREGREREREKNNNIIDCVHSLIYSIVREFLSGQPFIDYVESPYYWRYLQWKYLERYAIHTPYIKVYLTTHTHTHTHS